MLLRKYTTEWKLEEVRKRGKISVRTRNRVVKIRLRDSRMFILIGDKEYEVINSDSILKAIVCENEHAEARIENPDEAVSEIFVLSDLQIASRLW